MEPELIDEDFDRITKELMMTIAHDAGATTIQDPEYQKGNFKEEQVKPIRDAVEHFFSQHPYLDVDTDLEMIAIGESEEKDVCYGSLEGFSQLDNALNDFFENL